MCKEGAVPVGRLGGYQQATRRPWREGVSFDLYLSSPPHAAVSIQGDKNECWNDVCTKDNTIYRDDETIDSTT